MKTHRVVPVVLAAAILAPAPIVRALPSLEILQPAGGAACVVYTNAAVLWGAVSGDVKLQSVIWSNTTSGANGIGSFEGLQSGTSGWWRTPPLALQPGAQSFAVWATDTNGAAGAADTISITFSAGGLPAALADYTTGAVFATCLKVDQQWPPLTFNDAYPKFSWHFGDALSTASPTGMTRAYLGSPWTNNTYAVAIADADGNGRPDVFVANYNEQNYVLLNTGTNPAAWPRTTLGSALNDATVGIAVGDLTGDGRPEAVVANYNQQNYVFLNNGTNPSNWPRLNLGSALNDASAGVAVGDLNGDGRPDITVANFSAQNYVLLNNGGSPATWSRVNLGSALTDSSYASAIGDMTGDGRPDVAIANYGQPNYVLVNNGGAASTWTRLTLGSSVNDNSYNLAIADVTGDGRIDVVIANYSGFNYVLVNNGGLPNTWTRYALDSGLAGGTYSVAVGDLNGDGRPDVMSSGYFTESHISLNTGGTPDTWTRVPVNTAPNNYTYSVAIGDLSGDGRPDIVAGCSIEPNYVLMNHASAMPVAQAGYRIQVARSTNDFASGALFWDSGIVASSNTGDGFTSIRHGLACTNFGEYWWRVKLFSGSGMQSDWSAPWKYEIPTNQLHLSIFTPPPISYTTNNPGAVAGWVSWNATNLSWTNLTSGDAGTLPASGTWTQAVPLVWGNNNLRYVASGSGLPAVTQDISIVYGIPSVEIRQPGGGAGGTVYTNVVVLGGTALAGQLGTIYWSNTTSGASGSGTFEAMQSNTSAWWRTPPLALAGGAQTFAVWMVDAGGFISPTDTITITYSAAGIPGSFTDFTTGAVFATDLRVDLYYPPATLSDIRPEFSWHYGDGLNSGLPSSMSRVNLGTALTDSTRSVAAGDLNGDGRPDVIAGNYAQQNYVIFNNGGSPTNWGRVNLGSALADNTYAVSLADLNGDGRPDVVVGNDTQNYALLNNSATPASWVRYNLGSGLSDTTLSTAVGDVNGDGRPDVVVGNSSQQNYVILNNGGTPNIWSRVNLGSGLNDDTRAVGIADLTGDDRPDVVVGNAGAQNYVIVNNGGAPNTWSRVNLGSGLNDLTVSVAVGDVTGDGRPDVVVGNSSQQNYVLVNNGGSPDTWIRHSLGPALNDTTYAVSIADVTGDGRPDVLVGNSSAQNYVVVNSGGPPATWTRINLGAALVDATAAVAACDMNADGRLDVVVGNYSEQNHVLLNGSSIMPMVQTGYEIHVARSTNDLAAGNLFWDSGIVPSFETGDGYSSIRQGSTCTNEGRYWWRLRVFSPAGFQSEWSDPRMYEIPTNQLYLSIFSPAMLSFSTNANTPVTGWVSWNATALAWSNLTTGAGGTVPAPGLWTQALPVVIGSNIARFVASDAGSGRATQEIIIVYGEPLVEILEPNGGADATVHTNLVVLRGTSRDALLGTLYWTNRNTGVGGTGTFEQLQGSTSAWWRTPPLALATGTQQFAVWTVNAGGFSSPTDTISITYGTGGLPGNLNDFTTGAVFTTRLQVERQNPPVTLNNIHPAFSWHFGDALNTGLPSAMSRVNLGSALNDATYSVAVGDMTGDGRPDVVVGNYNAQNYALVNSGGSPDTWSRVDLGSPLYDTTQGIALSDLTADGRPDVVVGNSSAQNYALVNNGGSPPTWTRVNLGSDLADVTYAVAAGDVTGDGRPDVVVGNYNVQNFVLVNNGGTPNTWTRVYLGSATTDSTTDVAIGDVTGDGRPDVVIANNNMQNYVLVNNGGAPNTWTRVNLGSAANYFSWAVALGDVTGDGRLDAVIGNYQAQNHVLVNNGGSPDTWTRYSLGTALTDQTRGIAVGDMTGDGRPDIVAGNESQQNYVLINNGGTPDTWSRINLGSAGSWGTWDVAVGDLTADGRLDVVAVNYNQQNFVLTNNLASMPQPPAGYRLQVARNPSDFTGGPLFWDSGIVSSSAIGDGCSSVRQTPPCDAGGDYWWRVKAYSASGYQGDWSSATRYTIPTNQLFLSVFSPSPWYTTNANPGVTGWVSWNATSLVWSNQATGTSGSVAVPGMWTQAVPVVTGSNTVRFVAADAAGAAATQCITIVHGTPKVDILLPGDGVSATVYTNRTVPYGRASDGALGAVYWTNLASGAWGAATFEGEQDGTSAYWRTPPIALNAGAQTIGVWSANRSGERGTPKYIEVTYSTSGIPADPALFTTGAVFATGLRADQRHPVPSLGNATPAFSWHFGDALNTGSPTSMVRGNLGSLLTDASYTVAIGDMTADGRPDVAVGNNGAQNYLLVNNGASPTGWARLNLGSALNDNTSAVAIGDLNGDGLPDVVNANEYAQNTVLINNGGSPTNWSRVNLGSALNDNSVAVAMGDLTGDGRTDVIMGNYGEQNYVLINSGESPTNWARVKLGSGLLDATRTLAVGDLTGDNRADIVVGNYNEQNYVLVNNGASPTNWTRMALGSALSDATYSLALGDMNGDGRLDVIVGNYYQQSYVLLNDGRSPSNWPRLNLGSIQNLYTRSIAAADLTGDGRPDVVIGNNAAQNLVVMNTGGSPNAWPRLDLGSAMLDNTYAVAVADLNGDSRPDVIAGNYSQQNYVLMNSNTVMLVPQAAYRIEVARAPDDLDAGILHWDSGIVTSSNVGNGLSSVRMTTPCSGAGAYYWRLRPYAASGYQGLWTSPQRFDFVGAPDAPVVDITNTSAELEFEVAFWAIGGTANASVTGNMWWTNNLTGSNGSFAAVTTWTVTNIDLAVGTNTLTVRGTNAAGSVASDSVNMIRIPVDIDGDGIPNWWETLYFGGRTNAMPGGDADEDGSFDGDEYWAGTDPTNWSSCLQFLPMTNITPASAGGLVVRWSSVTDRYYRLERSTNLMLGFSHLVQTNIPATPPMNTVTDTSATANFPNFYRVELE